MKRLTLSFGLLATGTGLLAIVGNIFDITVISTVYPGYKTMALSASLVWIFFGLVLAASAIKPLEKRSGMLVQAALGIIAGVEAVELIFTLYGGNFFVESWLVQAGTLFFGTLSSPISPVAAGLIIPAAVSLAFMVKEENAPTENRRTRDAIGIVGLVLVLISFTFILSYFYGAPFLYGTPIIPIAAMSALAAFFIGGGLIAAGGPDTIPVRYLTGNSIRARLLRTFVPLSVAIVFVQNFAFKSIYQVYNVPEALFLSASLVIFAAGTVCAVSWVSTQTGDALDRAETALVRKNDELGVMNEELMAAEEELRQNIDELGKKQRELNESEHRLGRSQEIAHLGSWELDLDSNHLTWSDEVYRIFGLEPREFGATYEAFLDAVHPDDRPAVNAAYAGSLSEGQDGYGIEHRVVRKDDGGIRYVHEKCEHLRDETGRIIRSIGMVHDITERRLTEIRLRESEEKFRNLFEKMTEGFALHEIICNEHNLPVDYRFLEINPAFERLTGLKRDVVVGRRLSEILPDEDPRWVEFYGSVALTAKPIHFEQYSPALKNHYEVYAFSPAPQQFAVLFTNITDRKLAEEFAVSAKRKAEEALSLLNAALESTAEGIYVVDKERKITGYNQNFVHIWNIGEVLLKTGDDENVLEAMQGQVRDPGGYLAGVYDLYGHPARESYDIIELNDGRIFERYSKPQKMESVIFGRVWSFRDITAQRRAEANLRQTSQYLENLINYANAPIIVWDPDFRITRFNHAFERLTGRMAADVIGKDIDLLFPEPQRDELMGLIRKTSAGERWNDVEIPILTINGEIQTVLWNSATVYEPDGKTISSVIAQGQDITARKQADEIAGKTLSLLNAALDSTADGLLVVDREGKITSYNQSFVTMWNIPHSSLAGSTENSVLLPMLPQLEDPEGFRSGLKDLYAHPGRESYDMVEFIDGRVFERYSKPQRIGDTIVGRVWSYRDVTERRRAEEALRESEQKFRVIAMNTPDYILVQDTGLRYTSVINPQLGLSEDEMIGKTDYDILSKEEADNLVRIKKQVLKTGKPAKIELSLVSRTGEKNYFEGSYIPKFDGSGSVDGLIGYFRNMTEHKSAEEKIISSLAEKEILIREIHHRVKNNLQIISGLLDMTRMRTEDVATGSILTDMMLKIKTMAQIHTRLYESKQFDKINMGGQIRDQVADLSSIYRRSGTEIVSEIDAGEIYLPVDQAIPCALIVNEILSNAFKHAFKGRKYGKVSITAMKQDGHVHITVRDDGIGIPRELDISHATSLGIKLIRNLVQQLGGSLTINGSGGTEVIVEFPLPAAD